MDFGVHCEIVSTQRDRDRRIGCGDVLSAEQVELPFVEHGDIGDVWPSLVLQDVHQLNSFVGLLHVKEAKEYRVIIEIVELFTRVLVDEVVCTASCLEDIRWRRELHPVNIGQQLKIVGKGSEFWKSHLTICRLRHSILIVIVESPDLLKYRVRPGTNGYDSPEMLSDRVSVAG